MLTKLILVLFLAFAVGTKPPITEWVRHRTICPPSFEQALIPHQSPRFQELLLYVRKKIANFTMMHLPGTTGCTYHRWSNISVSFGCRSKTEKAALVKSGLTCETGKSLYSNVTRYVKNRAMGLIEFGAIRDNAGFVEYAIGYKNRKLVDMLLYISIHIGTIITYAYDFYDPYGVPQAEYYIDYLDSYSMRISGMQPGSLNKLKKHGWV